MPPPRASARARILDVADRLFYEHGVRAVGIEAIVAEACAAKTTLYGHFGSKDALVVAYLHRRAERARERLERGLAAHGGPAAARILHLYDLLTDELAEPGYRGSPFVNACVELGSDHPAAGVAREHRRWLLGTFAGLAVETGAPDPDALAAQLLQLYEAAAVTAQIDNDGAAARTARAVAEALLATSRRAPTTGDPPSPAPARRAPLRAATAPSPGGSPEAHLLVALLNSAHLPDGDDQLTDRRAGPWLARWLTDAGGAAPDRLGAVPRAPTELVCLREGLRELAAVNCGAEADPHVVADAAAVLERTPLVVDLAGGAEPRLTATDVSEPAGLAIALAAGAYLAARARSEWQRLKVCASPDCRWAFFDTTRNRSRRWCDMAGCGNRAKNRAWRDRHDLLTKKIG